MPSHFDIDGVKFDLLSHIPDEVLEAFHFLSQERYEAGLAAGRAEAAKPPTKSKAKPVERAE